LATNIEEDVVNLWVSVVNKTILATYRGEKAFKKVLEPIYNRLNRDVMFRCPVWNIVIAKRVNNFLVFICKEFVEEANTDISGEVLLPNTFKECGSDGVGHLIVCLTEIRA